MLEHAFQNCALLAPVVGVPRCHAQRSGVACFGCLCHVYRCTEHEVAHSSMISRAASAIRLAACAQRVGGCQAWRGFCAEAARTPLDYYKVLGVAPGSSNDVIKAAFRELAKRYHPDVGGIEAVRAYALCQTGRHGWRCRSQRAAPR